MLHLLLTLLSLPVPSPTPEIFDVIFSELFAAERPSPAPSPELFALGDETWAPWMELPPWIREDSEPREETKTDGDDDDRGSLPWWRNGADAVGVSGDDAVFEITSLVLNSAEAQHEHTGDAVTEITSDVADNAAALHEHMDLSDQRMAQGIRAAARRVVSDVRADLAKLLNEFYRLSTTDVASVHNAAVGVKQAVGKDVAELRSDVYAALVTTGVRQDVDADRLRQMVSDDVSAQLHTMRTDWNLRMDVVMGVMVDLFDALNYGQYPIREPTEVNDVGNRWLPPPVVPCDLLLVFLASAILSLLLCLRRRPPPLLGQVGGGRAADKETKGVV